MGGSESKGREGDGEAKESSGTALAKAIAGAAILTLGAGIVSRMGDSSKPIEEKNMKAPGRDERIPRAPFEENPADYFRKLRDDQRKQSSDTALVKVAIAGAAILILGVGIVSLMGHLSKPIEEKTMKAPGRDERIPRAPFEENPADYFRKLRDGQRKQ